MNIPIILLHVFRNIYVAPFQKNQIVNLQVYRCKVYTFVAIRQDRIWKQANTSKHFRKLTMIEVAGHHLQSVRLCVDCVSWEEYLSICRLRVVRSQLPPHPLLINYTKAFSSTF